MKMKGAKWAANRSVSALDHQSSGRGVEWKRQARRGSGDSIHRLMMLSLEWRILWIDNRASDEGLSWCLYRACAENVNKLKAFPVPLEKQAFILRLSGKFAHWKRAYQFRLGTLPKMAAKYESIIYLIKLLSHLYHRQVVEARSFNELRW